MNLSPVMNKIMHLSFIVVALIGALVLGRVGFVMGMSHFVNSEAQKGTHDPAEMYYLLQAYSGDFMEPYKAFYNAGTAYAQQQDYESAELFLTEALAKVNYIYSECLIRNNLSITYERLGDYYAESEQMSSAESYYDKAVVTVQEAPLECFPPPPSGGGDSDGGSEGEGSEESGGENPAPLNDEAKPDVSETGEDMEQTESESQSKGDQIRSEQGNPVDGQQQVENEQNQGNEQTSNQSDQTGQEQNQSSNPVEKPW